MNDKKHRIQLALKIIGFICYLALIIIVSCSTASFSKKETAKKIEITSIVENKVRLPIEKYEAKTIATTPEIKEEVKDLQNSIAIIIDDCGVDEKNTRLISNSFPKEITMSFLPYAKNVQNQVNISKTKGHTIMLHLPMEAIDYNEKGVNTLKTTWANEQLLKQTKFFLNSFTGYVGVNNHTGSKFTQNREKMDVVLRELKNRDLFFLDSVTIGSSVAYDEAKKLNIRTNKRNMFIDHQDDKTYIKKQLLKAEAFAKRNGLAIIIGHPRDNTISALKEWLPTLSSKDINLIPISRAIY